MRSPSVGRGKRIQHVGLGVRSERSDRSCFFFFSCVFCMFGPKRMVGKTSSHPRPHFSRVHSPDSDRSIFLPKRLSTPPDVGSWRASKAPGWATKTSERDAKVPLKPALDSPLEGAALCQVLCRGGRKLGSSVSLRPGARPLDQFLGWRPEADGTLPVQTNQSGRGLPSTVLA